MAEAQKAKSPFYPGQPVPAALFAGRAPQIERILTRGAAQVASGKPAAVFVEGEYGIGKSSLAGLIQRIAEERHGLFGVYVTLGGVKDLGDLSRAVLEATLRSGGLNSTRGERVRGWLTKYLGKAELFGFSLNVEAVKEDAPKLATPDAMLAFLGQLKERLKDTGVTGILLILDEINGISTVPEFAHFIKGLVDTNALSNAPLPLMLMLCGVAERRREMIANHRPVDRIFDVIEIEPMSVEEMGQFFTKAFESVGIKVEPAAMSEMISYSGGLPRVMHLIGDAAYWADRDDVISKSDAIAAILAAADEVGRKHVDQHVYKALRSADYHSILETIAKMGPGAMSFSKATVAKGLTDAQKRKFDNFLQKMKTLNVIRPGDVRGEWMFNEKMVRLYIWMRSVAKSEK